MESSTVNGFDNVVRGIRITNTTNFILLVIIFVIIIALLIAFCIGSAKLMSKDDKVKNLSNAVVLEQLTSLYAVDTYALRNTERTLVYDLHGARKFLANKVTAYPDGLTSITVPNDNTTSIIPSDMNAFCKFIENVQLGMLYVIKRQYGSSLKESPLAATTTTTTTAAEAAPAAAAGKNGATSNAVATYQENNRDWHDKKTIHALAVTERLITDLTVEANRQKLFETYKFEWPTRMSKLLEVISIYLLSKEPAIYATIVNQVIPKLMENVQTFLSYNGEKKFNVPLHMSMNILTPWILYKLYSPNISFKDIVGDKEYNNVLRNIQLPPIIEMDNYTTGRRYDQSYIYARAPRFDLLNSLYIPISKLSIANDLILKSYGITLPENYWKYIINITRHPTIGYRAIGLNGPQRSLQGNTNATSLFGIRVIPSISYLRYFTSNYVFSIRGAKPKDAKFIRHTVRAEETEDMKKYLSNNGAYYWEHYRGVVHKSQNAPNKMNFQFPDFGFICAKGTTELLKDHEVTGTKPNTEEKQFGEIESLYAGDNEHSFVLKYDNIGVFYYEHFAINMTTVKVIELIIVNSSTSTITNKTIINNTSETDIAVYYAVDDSVNLKDYVSKLKKYEIGSTTTKAYDTVIDLKNETIKTTETVKVDPLTWPITIPSTKLSIHYDKEQNAAFIRKEHGEETAKTLVATFVDLPKYPQRSVDIKISNDVTTTATLILNPNDSYQYTV